jgi:hypothetical protein
MVMHPNNKKERKIQADINLKQLRDTINVPLSLDALPDPATLKQQTFTFVGFYMLVYNAWKELELMPVLDVAPELNDRQKRKDSLHLWMREAEEHLPVWFSVRHLK